MQHHLIGIHFLKVVFMTQGKRDRLSTEQRIDMWRRWKAGESLHDIGRAFGKGHGSIRFLLTQRGGIVPAARRRSPRTLTLAEREDISRGIASGSSIREIASGLQRPVSTVSREVSRHGGRPLYRASEADRQTQNAVILLCFPSLNRQARKACSIRICGCRSDPAAPVSACLDCVRAVVLGDALDLLEIFFR